MRGARVQAEEGSKVAQYVVWMSTGAREKKHVRNAKFKGNNRVAVAVAEPDWHEFRWAVHNDMQVGGMARWDG